MSGYRTGYTTWQCLVSIFAIHNETGNIWTHLVGIPVFLYFTYLTYAKVVLEPIISHHAIFLPFVLANVAVMVFSTTFHTLAGHMSGRVYDIALKCDVLGVAILIVTCFFPPIYFGFSCIPFWRDVYITSIILLGSTGIIAPFVDAQNKYHHLKVALYIVIVVSGLLPTFHWALAFPRSQATVPPLAGIALMFLQYGIAVLCYLARVPERWFPGHFDYWLTSHQIWHIGVFCAMVTHVFTCWTVYARFESLKGETAAC